MPNKAPIEPCTGIGTDAHESRVSARGAVCFGKSDSVRKLLFLYSILACLIALYTVSFYPRSEKSIRTSLIQKKYVSSLDEIEIEGGDKKIVLHKKNGVWYGFAQSDIFPTENEKIENLIHRLIKIRKVSVISDSMRLANLDKNKPVLSILLRNNLKTSTKIDVLRLNFDGAKAYVRIEEEKMEYAFYEIENDFSSFMKSDADFWLDPYIVPQNTEAASIRASDIQSLRITGEGVGKTLRSGESGFSEKAEKLLALRHGGLDAGTLGRRAFSLIVETGSGFAFTMRVEAARDGRVPLFFDSFENTVTGARYEYRYRVSVSAWTLEKILALF